MTDIQTLERQLAEAKKVQKLADEDREMQELVDKYAGKCYANRKFRQKSKSTWDSAVRIEKIEKYTEHKFATGAGTIVLSYQSIRFHSGPDWQNHNSMVTSYSRNSYTTNLNQDDSSMHRKVNDLISGLKEISLETFQTIYSVGDEIEAYIEMAFSGKVELGIEKTCGDSTTQNVLLEKMNRLGIPYIDLEKHPQLLHTLRYARIPGFFEDRFLFMDYARLALNQHIEELDKRRNSWGTDARMYSALSDDINTVRRHMDILEIK